MKGRILIVEDMPDVLASLVGLIKEKLPESTIAEAATFAEAIRLINQKSPFDIVVTDMQLRRDEKNEEGLQVIKAARAKDPFTEIIVLTAYGTSDNLYRALELGANQYIDKTMADSARIQLVIIENRLMRAQLRHDFDELLSDPEKPEDVIESIDKKELFRYFQSKLAPLKDICNQLEQTQNHLAAVTLGLRKLREENNDILMKIQGILQELDEINSPEDDV